MMAQLGTTVQAATETPQRNQAGLNIPNLVGGHTNKALSDLNTSVGERLKKYHDCIDESKCKLHDFIRNQLNPTDLKVKLPQHHRFALDWMMCREKQQPSGGILAVGRAFGPLLTTISLILMMSEEGRLEADRVNNNETVSRKKYHKYAGGTLVVCPAMYMHQWDEEVKKYVEPGRISLQVYHGPKREMEIERLCKYDMVVTTYHRVSNDYKEFNNNSPLFQITWNRIVVDEAYHMKNHKTKTAMAICNLQAKSRWALTHPASIYSVEEEMFSVLKFLQFTVDNVDFACTERRKKLISSLSWVRTDKQLEEPEGLPKHNFPISKESVDAPTQTPTDVGDEEVISKTECVICCEKLVDTVLYRCGHMCMCYTCARNQWVGTGDGRCPICRIDILDVIRPYQSCTRQGV